MKQGLNSLIASIISDDELSEYAVNSVARMADEILATKESDDKQIAMNCDFDRTRNESYKMLGYAHTRLLQHMFDKKIFYMLAAVKIYGIKDTERKAQRYAIYTEQFAKAIGGFRAFRRDTANGDIQYEEACISVF